MLSARCKSIDSNSPIALHYNIIQYTHTQFIYLAERRNCIIEILIKLFDRFKVFQTSPVDLYYSVQVNLMQYPLTLTYIKIPLSALKQYDLVTIVTIGWSKKTFL